MNYELELFGIYLSNHPITEVKMKYPNTISISNIDEYFDKFISIIVNVDRVKEVITKKNDKMLFITGSDELKIIDIIVFPKIYQKYNNINKDDIILVKGKVEKRFDEYQIIASTIEIIRIEG